eukprot:Gb_10626 [translate_table: standard]
MGYDRGGAGENTEFKFDAVLPSIATQADVYNTAAQAVVKDVLEGYNGTIMAYGQTGAGKTYTLSAMVIDEFGGQTAEGIIPRSATDIFARIDEDNDHEYHVSMSYIQIYMEMIQDLLRPENLNLQIREGEDGDIFVAGVQQVEVKSVEDVVRLLMLGDCNRYNAFTKMNAHSSRSHAIVIFTVEKKSLHPGLNKNLSNARKKVVKGSGQSEKILIGKLFLVDLAGSERLKKSGSEGLRATEAMSVNMSLTALGKCISARADPSVTHIPFRESKLTRLLQESFGGNAKTSLIINIAPCSEYIHETLSSLQFGSRAMKVCTKAMVNIEEEFHVLSSNLEDPFEHNEESLFSLQGVASFESQLFQQPRSVLELENVELEKLTEEQDDPYVIYEKFLVQQRKRNEEWHHRLEVIKAAAKEHLYEQETKIERASRNLHEVLLKPHAECESGGLADDNFPLITNSTSLATNSSEILSTET